MQTVKTFVYGKDRVTMAYNPDPLDTQINEYLKEHPDQKIVSFSTIVGSGFHEAFVVFDIYQKKEQRNDFKSAKPLKENDAK